MSKAKGKSEGDLLLGPTFLVSFGSRDESRIASLSSERCSTLDCFIRWDVCNGAPTDAGGQEPRMEKQMFERFEECGI